MGQRTRRSLARSILLPPSPWARERSSSISAADPRHQIRRVAWYALGPVLEVMLPPSGTSPRPAEATYLLDPARKAPQRIGRALPDRPERGGAPLATLSRTAPGPRSSFRRHARGAAWPLRGCHRS